MIICILGSHAEGCLVQTLSFKFAMPAVHQNIKTTDAPASQYYYSQGVKVGSMMFVTSQIGINPVTKHLVQGGIQDELRQAFTNVRFILKAGGGKLEDIVMVKLCMKDLAEFEKMDLMYAEIMAKVKVRPARTVFQNTMMQDARVEVDAIAVISQT